MFLLGCRGQDAVEQPEGEMVHIEGGMVTLNCGYKTTRSTQDQRTSPNLYLKEIIMELGKMALSSMRDFTPT